MVVSNMTLVKVAAVGGILTVSMGIAARYKINSRIKDSSYYKEALTILRSNRGAAHLLGEPIKEGTIDVGDTTNYTKTDEAHYVVPVRGPKQKGTLHFWAQRNNDAAWKVTRIELGLDNEPHRRLSIKTNDY